MEERVLSCSFITPLFSYGAYRDTAEFRTAQVKGLMRYVYRILCPFQTQILRRNEGILFGEASDGTGHASPVRLAVKGQGKRGRLSLLLHDEKKGYNPSMPYLNKGRFQLSIKVRPMKKMEEKNGIHQGPDINWYTDLAILALTLCGLGRRSRKGRGAVAIDKMKAMDLEQAKEWILDALNQTAGVFSDKEEESLYILSDGMIKPCFKTETVQRPVIQKIWFGSRIKQEEITPFLKSIDGLCHDKLKKEYTGEAKATGYADGTNRLASPLWITLIRVKDGIYPVYTYVKALEGSKELDAGCKDRDAFAAMLEKKMERR